MGHWIRRACGPKMLVCSPRINPESAGQAPTRPREEIVADLMASNDAIARDLDALQRRHSGS